MAKRPADDSRVERIRHACSTLDQLHEETHQLYLSIEAGARRRKVKGRERAALKPVRRKR
jgi:hypothetical protein